MARSEPLSIGAVGGGPGTDRRWVAAVMALMRSVADLRASVDSPLAVNVVFHIPGPNLIPDFDGIRSGLFSRKDRKLMMQVALKPEAPAATDQVVRSLLKEAVLLAEDFAQQEAMIEGELTGLRELAERV